MGLIEDFLDDTRILPRVKFEDYLSVYLEIRPCSFFTLPAELPGGSEYGRIIDEKCAEDVALLLRTRDLYLRGRLILQLRNKIRKLFKELVLKSEVFKAHKDWAKALGLKMMVEEVRPSIYEVYIYRESKVGKRLKKLFSTRREIRKAIVQVKPLGLPPSLLVYPEELSTTYITELGELLGYPECCIKRYAEERSSGVYIEERASRQIKELKRAGDKPDIYAFFSSNFFPCTPKCPKASEIGRKLYEAISRLSPSAGKAFLKCLEENVSTVEKYPDLIAEYRRMVDARARGLISHM
ncbi:MAG: hypothetical protein DRJ26_04310 [Candidatus Methanomethylicota archaeon]|uniref:DUF483 domain-containing protein n=1 Tax=Thermoproteota archaeon TaxID=2056631 RepID=A0A497EZW6_9CREN|nr:MAG: hypothetical protein DRJ26_04310 [Candidatus Verstraetearchaeota archaeon]